MPVAATRRARRPARSAAAWPATRPAADGNRRRRRNRRWEFRCLGRTRDPTGGWRRPARVDVVTREGRPVGRRRRWRPFRWRRDQFAPGRVCRRARCGGGQPAAESGGGGRDGPSTVSAPAGAGEQQQAEQTQDRQASGQQHVGREPSGRRADRVRPGWLGRRRDRRCGCGRCGSDLRLVQCLVGRQCVEDRIVGRGRHVGGDRLVGIDHPVAVRRIARGALLVQGGQQTGDDLAVGERGVLGPDHRQRRRCEGGRLAGAITAERLPGYAAERRDLDSRCRDGQVGVPGRERRHVLVRVDRADRNDPEAHARLFDRVGGGPAVSAGRDEDHALRHGIGDRGLLVGRTRLGIDALVALAAEGHADDLGAVIGRVHDRRRQMIVVLRVGRALERDRDRQDLRAWRQSFDAERSALRHHDRRHCGAVTERVYLAIGASVPAQRTEIGAGQDVRRELRYLGIHAAVDLGDRDALAVGALLPQCRDLPRVEPPLRRVRWTRGRTGSGGRREHQGGGHHGDQPDPDTGGSTRRHDGTAHRIVSGAVA